MKKQIGIKIISNLILLILVVSIFYTPTIQAANESSLSNLYSNPNQSNSSTYKFKIKDVVNSNLLTSIVGCTGTVNKVSEWMSRFIQSPLQMGKLAKEEIAKKKKQLSDACSVVKAGAEAAGNSIPAIGGLADSISTKLESKVICRARVAATSDEEISKMIDAEKATTARDFKEQCFDGIAITLAKNQLTAMTRSAMNWVNSGYGGNPFFVQNMRNFTEGIERNVIETGTDILLDKALGGQNQNPYARDFARSTIQSRGITSSSSRFLGGLQSSLQNFITDPQSYYTDEQLNGAYDTRTTYERSQQANDIFSNNFSSGGWNAWLAFTQTPQNNPLGFNIVANQYIADMETQQVQEKKDELAQNNGFLSQKTCLEFMSKKDIQADLDIYNSSLPEGTDKEVYDDYVKQTYPNGIPCMPGKEKITTPGSIIKEKITNYLGSPERQLELAKTINDSLNALFSVLISKLQSGGLSGLSDSKVTTNWTDNLNRIDSGSNNNTSSYNNNGAYDGFNITRDLGNTYIHENTISLGTWNAADCSPGQEDKNTCNLATLTNTEYTPKDEGNKKIKLYPDIAPEVYQVVKDGEIKLLNDKYGNAVNPVNGYYTVTTAGRTKLISEGYNSWEVGDRAFWNGNEWQNWKKGQTSPIKDRGVIQIQQDYIVSAKEMLKILPGVIPALGELDYCLPGPNPNYKINSSNAQTAFNNWIGSSYVGATDTSGERFGVKIDGEGDVAFEEMKSTYKSSNLWNSLLTQKIGDITYDGETVDLSIKNVTTIFSNICNDKEKDSLYGNIDGGHGSSNGIGAAIVGGYVAGPIGAVVGAVLGGEHSYAYRCAGNYFYAKNGEINNKQNANLNFKTKIQEYLSKYAGGYLFTKFYEVFDQKMNEMYFKKMTNRYIEYENRPVSEPNPAYIEMAESGFEFTKNIVSYADDTNNAQIDYADAISKAKINIAKLDPIKNEVSLIIKKAQDRRDKNLIKILNEESERTGRKNAKGEPYVLSEAEYKKEYKNCLNEEDIQVFDVEDMIGLNEKRSEEACSDGVDNDLDGLIDSKDSDCGATGTPAPRVRTDRSSDTEE